MAVTSRKSIPARMSARRRKMAKWIKSPSGHKFLHRTGPALLVFLAVAIISYDDIRAVTVEWGFSVKHASLFPIAIDAGMIVGFHYLAGKVRPVAKIFGLLLCLTGFSLTMTCNVMAAPDHMFGRMMGAGVAILLGLTAVVLHLGGLTVRPKRRPVKTPAPVKVTAMREVRGVAPVGTVYSPVVATAGP